jgi:predicted DNA binding protein
MERQGPMIDISMDMEQYDCPFIDTTAEEGVRFSAYQWDFDRKRRALETRLIVGGNDRDELDAGLRALREHPNMHDYVLIARQDDVAQIRTVIDETDAMRTIRGNDGYITGPFHIEDGSEIWHVGFDRANTADDTLAELERNNEYDVVERDDVQFPNLQQLVQNAGAAMTLIEGTQDLSDVEQRTLERAVDDGYFETPRDATLGELAEEFDVSKPAVSKNLRRGQQRLLEHVMEANGKLDDE